MKAPAHILVLTYWSIPDALIQAYTLPYLRIIRKHLPPGSRLSLLTLERPGSVVAGGNSWASSLAAEGIEWVPGSYYPFGWRAIMYLPSLLMGLIRRIREERVSTIHCWATPAGALGYFLSLVSGVQLVLDSYEPHAEAMVENGTWSRNGIPFRMLFALEKLQTRRAAAIIAANGGMRDYASRKYGATLKGLLIKPACVDLELFKPKAEKDAGLLRELGLEGKRVAVYAGKFGGIYLDTEVFAFLKEAHMRWGDNFRALILTNHTEEEIAAFCTEVQLDRSVVIRRFVSHTEVPRYLSLADFALTPVKPVPTKRYCTPIKDGEYWAMGLPVVIPPDISDDSAIIKRERLGAVWETLDSSGYRKSLEELELLLSIPRPELQQRVRQLAIRYRSFSIADKVYASVYGQ